MATAYNSAADATALPSTALSARLETMLNNVLNIEQGLNKYEQALGEYTLPMQDSCGTPEAIQEGRPTISQYLTWLERAVNRIQGVQDNLNNVIL